MHFVPVLHIHWIPQAFIPSAHCIDLSSFPGLYSVLSFLPQSIYSVPCSYISLLCCPLSGTMYHQSSWVFYETKHNLPHYHSGHTKMDYPPDVDYSLSTATQVSMYPETPICTLARCGHIPLVQLGSRRGTCNVLLPELPLQAVGDL